MKRKKVMTTLGSICSLSLSMPILISCKSQPTNNEREKLPWTKLTHSNNVIKMKEGQKEFWSSPKHFFYIMADSLTSSRLLDTYNYLKEELKNTKDETSKQKIEKKINALDDFDLKMNVVSPGYGTAAGLGALLGGAKNAAFVQELRRKENVSRKFWMGSAWNNMLEDIGKQKNIKKIYINSSEYYKTSNKKGDEHRNEEIKAKEEFNVSKDTQAKIVLANFQNSHDYYNSENVYKILDDYGDDIKKESNFTFINSLLVHDDFNQWDYNKYFPPFGKHFDFLETLSIFKDKLKKLGIYDNSEIMIVSDHGKQMNNYNKIKKSQNNFELKNEYLDLDYPRYELKGLDQEVTLKQHVNKTKKDLLYSAAPLAYMTSILHKPFNYNNDGLKIDAKNLYYSADAISQLYFNMYIPTDNLQFNFFDYISSKSDKENKNGSYNSFINDPFHQDLSQRVLFSLRKNTSWGLRKSMYLSNKGFIWNGPFWYQDKNKKWKIKNDSIIEFILDNKKSDISPWLDILRIKELKKSPNAYSLVGKVLNKFLDKIKFLKD